jgi:NADPH-dependent curcumin reductase CurA
MKMAQNLKILIDSLPSDKLTTDAYRVAETPIPNIGDNEVLVKTTAVAITAGTRAGLQGSASYAGAPKTGIVMNGTGVGEVAASNSAEFSVGEAVRLTAYFGLFNIGRPKAGETVMVSAAAGSVGHMVGQMAKISDTRVVGVCGSDAKALTLTDALGFDAVVNYKEDDFRQALKAATPDGVDVYFDNTGGDILGSALRRLNVGGRIACCGVVSQYDTGNPAPGPRGIPGLLINKRIHMCGFLVFDFADQYADARAQISQWLASGQLKHLIDEVTGLEAAPGAFVDLLAGGNVGTRVVRVS